MEEIQAWLRGAIRLIKFILTASGYFAAAFWIHLTTKEDAQRRKKFSENACRYCARICKLNNIVISVKNPLSTSNKGLIIGNHLGFIDIMAMNSLMPSLFVTSREMHETPFLGLITEFAGCVYVERRSRTNIINELFPEATSHNGDFVLPFKRTLITSAAFAGVPIYPYVFNFKSIDGQPFSKKNRDSVCYYGPIPFYKSMWSSFKLKEIAVEVEFLPPINITPDDDRAEVANRLHKMISEKFIPVKDL
jgi:1-acyl-sn-glycerol-3-phosphate acyltransferase